MQQHTPKHTHNIQLIREEKLIKFDDVPASLQSEAKSLIAHALSTTRASTTPQLIHLCGIPGSGKSTYAQQFIQDNPGYVLVSFDNVMESLSGYQHDKQAIELAESDRLVEAHKNWELPARAVGYHLLQVLLENNRHVLFDHSAAFHTHLDLIDTVKTWGYTIEMHYLECAPEIAIERVSKREKVIMRHTPERLIWERHPIIQELLPLYQSKVNKFVKISAGC